MLVTSTRYVVANCVITEILGDVTGYSAQSPIRRVLYFVNRDFDRLLKIEIELKSHSVSCFCMLYVSTF